MKLNASNLTTKLYLWFYGITEEYLPTNLCPYFWKLVIMLILIVPYSIYCLPVIIFELIIKIWKKENYNFGTGERVGTSFFIYFLVLLLSSLIIGVTLLWTSYSRITNPILHHLSTLGVFLWFIILVVGSYYLIKGIYEYIRERNGDNVIKYDEDGYRIYTEPKVNILKEFVKAKYRKYCPRIEWVNNKK